MDPDLDGFGPNCTHGADCDNSNPLRTDNCDRVESPNCDRFPTATGCPCVAGTRADCYPGASGTEDVGLCHGGRTLCVNGYFGLCTGAVVPSAETCNEQDDDCNGLVDNGVLSPCGGCNADCTGGAWGNPDIPFVPNGELTVTSLGWLTLRRQPPGTTSLWVTNTGEDTVSKIDLNSAVEVARYPSGGEEPTRVAVDYNGDAWIVNRAYGGQSALTKIAGGLSRCEDHDHNGIETSGGPSDVLPQGEDECVIFTVPLGSDSPPAGGRTVAVDGNPGSEPGYGGSVWVGLHDAMAVEERDGQTGQPLRTVPTPGFSPYVAAFDAWGILWLISQDGILARIDPSLLQPVPTYLEAPLACYLLYGLALDANEDLLMSGFHCDQIVHYSPDTDVWRALPTEPSARGVAALGEFGFIAHTDGRLSKLDMSAFMISDVFSLIDTLAHPFESVGVASSGADNVWVISSQDLLGEQGVVTQLDAANGTVMHQIPVGHAPHTQGDATGNALRGAFLPEGSSTHVFEGCQDNFVTHWKEILLEAESGTRGSIGISLRRAPKLEDLASATWTEVGVFPADAFPAHIDVPPGGLLEVKATLRTSGRDGAPRLKLVGVEWECLAGGIF